jgi:hypothetical protein
MSTENAKTSSAIEPRAAQMKTPRSAQRLAPVTNQDPGLILAQIPDLNSKTVPAVPAKRVDGRIISQALSIKLIFGVGFILIIGAILPFVFGRASRPVTPVKELPEWTHQGASAPVGNAAPTVATSWPSAPTANTVNAIPTRSAPEVVMPKTPQVGDMRPKSLPEPAWTPPRPSVTMAAGYTPGTTNYNNPPAAANPPDSRTGSRADNRADYRGYERAVNPGTLQADNRNDPAARYRNADPRYDYRGAPSDAGAPRQNAPAPDYPRDNRYDNGGNYPPAVPQGSALMPSGAPSAYRPQNSEPGVARFDGSISPPPTARTNYDRAGSSNY